MLGNLCVHCVFYNLYVCVDKGVCVINPILYEHQYAKLPEIYQDYKTLRKVVSPDDDDSSIFDTVPIYGKLKELPSKLVGHDYSCASALATLAVLNGPEEIGDLFSAMKQIKSKFTGKPYTPPYDNKIAQHPFSFFQGSILREYMNPLSSDCVFPKLSKWLLKFDKSLLETRLGKFICEKLGISVEKITTTLPSIYYTEDFHHYIHAFKVNSNNPFKDLLARSMLRTSVLGTLAIVGIGSMHVKHKVDDGADFLTETKNTALSLGSTIVGVGSLGALGAKHFGAAGSLLGVAAGTLIGAKVSGLFS